MSAQYDRLCHIDIPKARAEIVKSISLDLRMHRLSELMEQFALSLAGAKRIDARAAGKLEALLQAEAPELKTYRVILRKSKMLLSNRIEYDFRVFMYDMGDYGEQSYSLQEKEDGTLDIEYALQAHRKWKLHAEFLETQLQKFAYNAAKFNNALDVLRQISVFAKLPDEHYPVYPLSDFFHWYHLNSPG